MARHEHHSAYAFLIYCLIFLIWKGEIVPGFAVLLIIACAIFPDLDFIYWILKKKGKLNTEFQHHLYYWTHWPQFYIPLNIVFLIGLFLNFYPEYLIIPIVAIYLGHLIPDSISTGDGIMWGKIIWKKNKYARFINIFAKKTDGYHGNYWEARYRKTFFFKLGHVSAVISFIIILYFQYISETICAFYIITMLYFLISIIFGLKKIPKAFYNEPPEGRYADYRKSRKYINGLSQKNKLKHLEKYASLLDKD